MTLGKYEYIEGSDSLEKSSADNLFLSYSPEQQAFTQDETFDGSTSYDEKPAGVSHSKVLEDPYRWM